MTRHTKLMELLMVFQLILAGVGLAGAVLHPGYLTITSAVTCVAYALRSIVTSIVDRGALRDP
jgi:hypothetical protein